MCDYKIHLLKGHKFWLQGYVLGNPSAFPAQDNFQVRFANGMGLITDELYQVWFTTFIPLDLLSFTTCMNF